MISRACLAIAAVSIAWIAAQPAHAQGAGTTFFVTSTAIGNGGNLGGLAGADNYCQTLAQAAGAGAKTWRAYLSTQAADGKPAVNARDRVGKGPWQNAKGAVVAKDVAELHGANNLTKQTALSEKGDVINGRGDTPARTGRAARKVRQWSAIPTASACATTMPQNPGTHRIPRAAPTAAARRPI
jgi:hypothetical protein